MANIAAGTSTLTRLVLQKGLKKFIELLKTDKGDSFKVDIVWILANIAGDSASCRDSLLKADVLTIIIKLLENTYDLELQKKCIWFVINLVRDADPALDPKVFSECIPTITKYLKHVDTDILINTLLLFKHLANGPIETSLMDFSEITQRLVDLIGYRIFFSVK